MARDAGRAAIGAALLLAAGRPPCSAESFRAFPATPPSGFERSLGDSLAAAAKEAGLDASAVPLEPSVFPVALDAASVESPAASAEAAKPKTFWISRASPRASCAWTCRQSNWFR